MYIDVYFVAYGEQELPYPHRQVVVDLDIGHNTRVQYVAFHPSYHVPGTVLFVFVLTQQKFSSVLLTAGWRAIDKQGVLSF